MGSVVIPALGRKRQVDPCRSKAEREKREREGGRREQTPDGFCTHMVLDTWWTRGLD